VSRTVKKEHLAYLKGKPRFVYSFHKLVLHKWFDTFIIMVIVANTVTLSMDHYMMSADLENNLSLLNRVFTAIFAGEMACKLIGEVALPAVWLCQVVHVKARTDTLCVVRAAGLGWRLYFKNPSNCFDAVVVFFSLVEIGLGERRRTVLHYNALLLLFVFGSCCLCSVVVAACVR
jgi:hypothetical protein